MPRRVGARQLRPPQRRRRAGRALVNQCAPAWLAAQESTRSSSALTGALRMADCEASRIRAAFKRPQRRESIGVFWSPKARWPDFQSCSHLQRI